VHTRSGNEIFVWTADYQRIRELNLEMPVVQMVQKGAQVVVASKSSILLVDIRAFERVARWDAHTQRITTIGVVGDVVWSGAKDKLLCVWEAPTTATTTTPATTTTTTSGGARKLVRALRRHAAKVTALCVVPSTSSHAHATAATDVSAKQAAAARRPTNTTTSSASDLSSSPKRYGSTAGSGSASVAGAANSKASPRVDASTSSSSSSSVLTSSAAPDVWSCADDGTVYLWDATTMEARATFTDLPCSPAFAAW
jgi:hypothetical protein